MADSKSRLKDPKVCRIFFSSPFNGMEGEREALTKLYWPRIQSLCSSKGIQFVPVDMRWGITSEMADNAQTINICLREADRSDMFVGFYGQRYGWFGAEDEALQRNFDVASAQYPWVDGYRDRSVTELEFLHGHLNHPGKLPAAICFRDKAFDDKLRAEAEATNDERGIYKYSSESELATLRMDDLKKRVKESEEKCLAVNMSYKDPEEGAKLMFDAIFEHLSEVILKDTSTEKLSKRKSDFLQHSAFIEAQDGIYVGGEKYYESLNKMISDPEKPVILITGEAGCGKSALLANWVKQRQEQDDSDYILIYHFMGSTKYKSGMNILQRLIGTMFYELYPENDEKDEMYMGLMDGEICDCVAQLQRAMKEAVEKQRNVVFVVDGLNLIEKKDKISKSMYWCPPSFPRGVHIIFSTQSTDTDNIQELASTHSCQTLAIEALVESDRREICRETLTLRGKELSTEQLATLVGSTNTDNPLYLKIVLEELCMFGRFRELSKKIESLVSSQNAQELFGKFLDRLETDYDAAEYEGRLVEKVMCAIYLSRQGLTESELTAMYDIPSHLWSPLYFGLEKYLVNRRGFLSFVHDELKSAIESRYLVETGKRKAAYLEQIDYYSKERVRRKYDDVHIDLHFYTELPWLCQQAADKAQLLKFLVNPTLFETLFAIQKYELLSYWQYLELSPDRFLELLFDEIDIRMIEHYCQEMDEWREITNAAAEVGVHYLETVQDFMSFADFHKANEKVLARIKNILEVNTKFDADYRERSLARTKYDLACLHTQDDQYQKALALHLEGIQFYTNRIKQKGSSVDLVEILANSYHGCAVACYHLGMLDEAEKSCTKVMATYQKHSMEKTHRRIHNTQHMLTQVYAAQGNYERAASELEDIIKVEEELHFGTLPPALDSLLFNLGTFYRHLEQFDKAEKLYKRAMQIKVNALGEVHTDVAMAYVNLSNLSLDKEDWDEMAAFNIKAIDIFEKIGQGDCHAAHLAHDTLAQALVMQKKMEEAEPHFWDIFDYLVGENKLDSALPCVQREFMRYFSLERINDKAKRVILAHMSTEHVCPLHFRYLNMIDNEEAKKSGEAVVERPHEHSLHRGIELYPDDAETVGAFAKRYLIPVKDMAAINQHVEKFYSVSEDQTDELVVYIGNTCLESGWPSGATQFYQRWISAKFEDSETLWHNLAAQHAQDGDMNQTLECMRRALELNPESLFRMESVAKLAVHCEEWALAKTTLIPMVEKWGHNEEVMTAIMPLLEKVLQWERQQEEVQEDEEGEEEDDEEEGEEEDGEQDEEEEEDGEEQGAGKEQGQEEDEENQGSEKEDTGQHQERETQ